MNCAQCGMSQAAEDAKFCNGCGAPLTPNSLAKVSIERYQRQTVTANSNVPSEY